MNADSLPEAVPSSAWESPANNKRHSAVISATAGGRTISKEKLNFAGQADMETESTPEPPPLDIGDLLPSDPEYVVQKMIDELQREVEFWKDRREAQQRQHDEYQQRLQC